MSRLIRLFVITGLLSLVAFGSTPKPGDPAHKFTLPNAKGSNVSLDDYKGKSNLVLVFYRGDW